MDFACVPKGAGKRGERGNRKGRRGWGDLGVLSGFFLLWSWETSRKFGESMKTCTPAQVDVRRWHWETGKFAQGLEHLLLPQRIRVEFPVSMSDDSQLPVTLAPGRSHEFYLWRYLVHTSIHKPAREHTSTHTYFKINVKRWFCLEWHPACRLLCRSFRRRVLGSWPLGLVALSVLLKVLGLEFEKTVEATFHVCGGNSKWAEHRARTKEDHENTRGGIKNAQNGLVPVRVHHWTCFSLQAFL